MDCLGRVGGLLAAVFLFVAATFPAMAGNFELEFQTVTEGGGKPASANYETTVQVIAVGAVAAGQSSSYEIQNVLSLTPTPVSEVELWMLY